MNKKILTFVVLANISLNGLSETYKLNKHETVSELLKVRLKISPIYQNRYLAEVLNFNNLTFEQARRLPIGAEIKLPESVIAQIPPSEVAPEPEVTAPIEAATVEDEAPSNTPSRISLDHRIGLGVLFDRVMGEEKSVGSSYDINIIRPVLSYELKKKIDKHELEGRLSVNYLYVMKDNSRTNGNQFLLGDASLQYAYDLSSFWSLGLKGKYFKDIYLLDAGNSTYKVLDPWLYGFGPVVKFGESRHWSLSYLTIPNQNATNGLDTRNNFITRLGFETVFNDHPIQFGASYTDSSTDQMSGKKYGLSAEYFFDL